MASRMQRNFMIDIETVGLDAYSVVWQVSCVEFVIHADHACIPIGNDHTSYLDHAEQMRGLNAGRLEWSDDTADWLSNQPCKDEFHAWRFGQLGADTGVSATVAELHEALTRLGIADADVWCKGADFDFSILKHQFALAGLREPWQYSRQNCMRAWLNEGRRRGWQPPKVKTQHSAWQDCVDQISLLSAARQFIFTQARL